MFVKVLTVDIHFPGCTSLKQKRFVLSSLKTRLRQRFNVGVSEVAYQNKWQRSLLAVVTVGPKRDVVDSGIDKVLKMIENDHRLEVLDYLQEIR